MAIREIDLGIVRGPQGIQGARGPQGIQGIQGIQGPKGDPGVTPAAASKVEAQAGTENTKYMTSKRVRESLEGLDLTPIGDIVYRPYLKAGYVKANGATVNRTDYPSLVKFATDNNLWTSSPTNEPWKFGQGDGSKTMVLPDYRNRFIQGGDSVTTKSAGLPNIIGRMYTGAGIGKAGEHQIGPSAYVNSALVPMEDSVPTELWTSGGTDGGNFKFDASLSNPIYGSSTTVQPPSILLVPQIKC